MFEVYVDKPLPSSEATTRKQASQHEPRLTNLAISCAGKEATLSPRLNFESFADLKAQVEALVPSLPEFGEGTGWLVFSLQLCDERGSLITLLPSTYDPSEFCEPRLPSGQKVYLRATVAPSPSFSVKDRAPSGAPPRRALGRRDENTLPAAAATRGGREGGAAGKATPTPAGNAKVKATPARKAAPTAAKAAKHAATPTTAKAGRLPVPSQRSKTVATAIAPTPRQQLHSSSSISSGSRSGMGRPPAYVFKAGAAGGGGGGGGGGSSGSGPSSTREVCSKPPLPNTSKQQKREKPGWNKLVEPAWEEAERKKAAMRKAARARILGKRAAAAAKQARGGAAAGKGGAGRGGKARVFRRAKRDCLVMDARRKQLGAYLFCDPIGALPPALGKRHLEAFRELGRAAAAQMKYVAIADEDPAPKRGKGEATATEQGQGRAFAVFPRGDKQRPQTVAAGPAAAAGPRSADDAHAAANPKVADKRVVVVASKPKPTSFATPAKKIGGAARAPAALRPPTARPGDIGFFRGGIGFRMRPPSTLAPPPTVVPAPVPAAAAAAARSRGRDGRGNGGGGGGGGAASVGQGAAALTAAAAAKIRVRAAGASSTRGSASIRGSARQRGGGAVAAYKEAKGSRAAQEDAAAAAAIMAKLAGGGGRGKGKGRAGGGGGGAASGEGEDVESLQEQVALLKAAAGLSDEELTWRMETAKPEANAYRIASAALERAETTYERLLWRQGQLEIARARLTGKGAGGDAATAAFADAVSRVATAAESTLRQVGGSSMSNSNNVLSRLASSSEAVLATIQEPSTTAATSAATAALPADVAAEAVRAAAAALAKLVSAVKATASTGSEVDYAAVKEEVAAEARALKDRADGFGRDLAALGRRVEAAVGQMEAWQQRKAEAPEFAAEEAAREEAWNEANREANEAALREMRALLPEAVWDMNAGDIQAAAAAAATAAGSGDGDGGEGDDGSGGVFYPSDLCVRLRDCRPLHWLVSAPEDIAGANFLAGDGAGAFTQLEGMDVVEMRAVWSVLPREFCRDGDGKKAEWRARFRQQLEGLARQQDGAVVTAGWDPVRGRRATTRMPPLPANRRRHPAYSYPTVESMELRVAKLREQQRRLATRKERLSALEAELAEAKSEVDSACADARSSELRERYGADTLRSAREAAKEAHSALVREKKSLSASVVEAEKMLSSTYPTLEQLESEVQSIAQIRGCAATTTATARGNDNNDSTSTSTSTITPEDASSKPQAVGPAKAETTTQAVRIPGAFSSEPELRRRSVAAARKLSPEEERRLRAREVQRAVSSRDAGTSAGSRTGGATPAADADTVFAGDGGDSGAALDQPGSSSAAAVKETTASRVQTGREVAKAGSAATGAASVAATAAVAPGRDECVDGAPPPRRPVKVAPGVLALLTKQYSARAVAAGGGRRRGGSGASETSREETKTSARTEGSGVCPPQVSAPAAMENVSAKPAGQAVKPISKSLAALIARKTDNPKFGLWSSHDGASSGVIGGGSGAGVKAASPSLGFLGELKAKTAARNDCPAAPSSSSSPPLTLPPTLRGAVSTVPSFLDELKARAARIS